MKGCWGRQSSQESLPPDDPPASNLYFTAMGSLLQAQPRTKEKETKGNQSPSSL